MRTAASVFSWLGGIATTIFGFVYLSKGQTVTYTTYNYYYGYSQSTQTVPYPAWLWVLWVIFVIVRLIILIWRQVAVENGNKVGCGVCTLLFASVIGGILTLCIPEDQLGGYKPSSYHSSSSYHPSSSSSYGSSYRPTTSTSSSTSTTKKVLTEDEKIELINKYKKLLDDGVITQEEFESKKSDLLNK